ncbi:TetR/AcrR family transcriptional regulator [Microbacterium azadirachtae]|uniref:TetR/AcrR family transcriptional regulator n=1 Tax=Microbacterium azadirachtae TaxID=582680 RepID=UPI00088451B0|nr:TetR/AcrR family transcriptional regulator [Microbacterium azadirachtae]UXW87228.1 TetR/AcrR family transcriptional regulator [Microbacterium azadirachtae]SDL15386.1 DNA-binding transcriptional regulator, AcrR family [Microbacterium azadirachtae]SEF45086.1 DNA-binding transcriptional regulator, AcrR family [Microbacterium azadirachtae]SEF45097.1 DNA-binding transcriptional regulator, AcrR family [Microbacterium azadirachtae]
MPEERRARLTPDERRAQLVATGVNFLADHPLDELTMDVLAQRAGVSRPLLFHYFDTRQGMHLAVVTMARDSLLRASEPRDDLEPRDRIRDTLLRITEFVRQHQSTFHSLVRGIASGDPAVRRVVDESRDLNAQRLIDAFTELGTPDTPALRVAMRSWVAFTEETLLSLVIDRDEDPEQVVRFLEGTLDGVVAATGALQLG